MIGFDFLLLLIATPDDTPRDSQPEVILLLSHCRYYRQGRNLSTALTIITSSLENVKVGHQLQCFCPNEALKLIRSICSNVQSLHLVVQLPTVTRCMTSKAIKIITQKRCQITK